MRRALLRSETRFIRSVVAGHLVKLGLQGIELLLERLHIVGDPDASEGGAESRCALVPSTGANIRIAFSNILEVLFSHLLKLTAEGKQIA